MKIDFRRRREKTAPWPPHLFSSQSHLKNILIIAFGNFLRLGSWCRQENNAGSRICLCTLNKDLFQWGFCPVQPFWSRVQVSGFVNAGLHWVLFAFMRELVRASSPPPRCAPLTHTLWDSQHPCKEPHIWAPVSHGTCGMLPSTAHIPLINQIHPSQAVGHGGNHSTSAGAGALVAVTEHKQSFGFLQWRHLINPDSAEGNIELCSHGFGKSLKTSLFMDVVLIWGQRNFQASHRCGGRWDWCLISRNPCSCGSLHCSSHFCARYDLGWEKEK